MKFAEHVLVRLMREPNKLQLVLRWLGHLASIAAIGLAAAWPTSNRNGWPASIWNAWPASS